MKKVMKKNSYREVLKKFGIEPEELFNEGMAQIVRIDKNIIRDDWEKLKTNVEDENATVYVRGHGRGNSPRHH